MSTVTNAPFIVVGERYETTEAIKEFTTMMQDLMMRKKKVFLRVMLVEQVLRADGQPILDPEDGEPIVEVYTTVDVTYTDTLERDGRIRFGITTTAVSDKNERADQNMALVGGQADTVSLLTHLVNIINTHIDAKEPTNEQTV